MNYSLLKKCLVSHCKIFSFSGEVLVLDFLSDLICLYFVIITGVNS